MFNNGYHLIVQRWKSIFLLMFHPVIRVMLSKAGFQRIMVSALAGGF
jgi:hypothetical protein